MKVFTLIVPDQLDDEVTQLAAHYLLGEDTLLQKLLVDAIVEAYEERVLDHKNKRKDAKP